MEVAKLTLAEVREKTPQASLPKLGKGDYSILWTSGWWDGPKSGLLIYQGTEYWFEMIQESGEEEDTWYRRYAVVTLNAEQLALERQIHADFILHVRDEKALRPKDQWHLFYDKHLEYCRNRPYDRCAVIAWFER